MAKVISKEEKAAAAAAKKPGGRKAAGGAAKSAAKAAPAVQAPMGNHTAAAAMAATLPVRGDDHAAADRRAALMSKIGTLKEHPKSIIANDFIERSFPTASIVIDEVLGIREIPAHGRMIQVHGEEHSGKGEAGARHPRPPVVHPENGPACVEYPEEQRRLVVIGVSVQIGYEEVAAGEHLPGHAEVARLVDGNEWQGVEKGEGEQTDAGEPGQNIKRDRMACCSRWRWFFERTAGKDRRGSGHAA